MADNIAALLIDMQEEAVNRWMCPIIRNMVDAQKSVLEHCRENDWPVASSNFRPWKYGRTLPELLEKVKAVPRYIELDKNHESCFCNPELERQLNQWECNHLLLMGCQAMACVRVTAIDATRAGLKVYSAWDLANDLDHPREDGFGLLRQYCTYYPKTHQELIESLQKI
jgi:nicotinamidase-related amidase